MTPEEKRRLKKLGKERVEESGRALRELLQQSNPVGMHSPEYVANEISLREKEKILRNTFRVVTKSEVDRDFLIRELPNESVEKHTVRFNRFFSCRRCDSLMPVQVVGGAHCRCGNIIYAVKNRRFIVRDSASVVVVQLLPKVADAGPN